MKTPDEFENALDEFITEMKAAGNRPTQRDDVLRRGYARLLDISAHTDYDDPKYLCWCALYLEQV